MNDKFPDWRQLAEIAERRAHEAEAGLAAVRRENADLRDGALLEAIRAQHRAQLAEVQAQAAAMRRVLLDVEWIWSDRHNQEACVSCEFSFDQKHGDDCELAAALAPGAGRALLERLKRAERERDEAQGAWDAAREEATALGLSLTEVSAENARLREALEAEARFVAAMDEINAAVEDEVAFVGYVLDERTRGLRDAADDLRVAALKPDAEKENK